MGQDVLIILGDAPAQPGVEPWKGKAGRKIAELLGLTYKQFLESPYIHRCALSNGRPISGQEAVERWYQISDEWNMERLTGLVLVCGREVAQATSFDQCEVFDSTYPVLEHRDGGILWGAMVPELGSSWWNHDIHIHMAEKFFEKIGQTILRKSFPDCQGQLLFK